MPAKLKLEEVEVESFSTVTMDEDAARFVEALMMVTKKGQTNLCTNCGMLLCAA